MLVGISLRPVAELINYPLLNLTTKTDRFRNVLGEFAFLSNPVKSTVNQALTVLEFGQRFSLSLYIYRERDVGEFGI